LENFIKNNLCKVSRRVSRPRPSLETPPLISTIANRHSAQQLRNFNQICQTTSFWTTTCWCDT